MLRAWMALLIGGLLFSAGGFMGCASRVVDTTSAVEVRPDVKTIQQLQHVGESLDADLQRLLAFQQATTNPPDVLDAPNEGPLSERIDFLWSGPVEPALRSLSSHLAFQVKRLGKPPLHPPVVMIDARNTPIFDILQSMGLQLGEEAGIHVKPETRTLYLVHVRPSQKILGRRLTK